jgi:hypothetical protein
LNNASFPSFSFPSLPFPSLPFLSLPSLSKIFRWKHKISYPWEVYLTIWRSDPTWVLGSKFSPNFSDFNSDSNSRVSVSRESHPYGVLFWCSTQLGCIPQALLQLSMVMWLRSR